MPATTTSDTRRAAFPTYCLLTVFAPSVSETSCLAILAHAKSAVPDSSNRWKRYEKQRPGDCVQVDVKFIEPLPGTRKKHYQFTAIDDCTRLRVLRIYPHNNQKTAIQFIDYVEQRLPLTIETIQTDNGAEFQSSSHWHVFDEGMRPNYAEITTIRTFCTFRPSNSQRPGLRLFSDKD